MRTLSVIGGLVLLLLEGSAFVPSRNSRSSLIPLQRKAVNRPCFLALTQAAKPNLCLLFSTGPSQEDDVDETLQALFTKLSQTWDIREIQDPKEVLKQVREKLGTGISIVGVRGSMVESILANPGVVETTTSLYQILYDYMDETGILDDEIKRVLNWRLIDNQAIVGLAQAKALAGRDRRDDFVDAEMTVATVNQTFSFHEAQRYSRYAIAAYGDAIIKAANIDTYGTIDLRLGEWTNQRIAEHVQIPEKDLILVDAEYYGDAERLRHFIAIDHENQKVVLTIRGTFTHSEIAIDVNGYTRPFLQGQSHAAISLMSERLWEKVRGTILRTMEENEGYELIVTGHSLGGGATLCINLLLHEDSAFQNKAFRAFAYASPPVYAPRSKVSESCKTAVNYIHKMDEVPFLAADSVRHLLAAIAKVDEFASDMDLSRRAKLLLGLEELSDDTINDIMHVLHSPLPAKPGAPVGMALPCMTNVWLWDTDGKYNVKFCDPDLLANSGIHVHPDKTVDHFPARYEYALMNLAEEYL